jgi:hypothetical protein
MKGFIVTFLVLVGSMGYSQDNSENTFKNHCIIKPSENFYRDITFEYFYKDAFSDKEIESVLGTTFGNVDRGKLYGEETGSDSDKQVRTKIEDLTYALVKGGCDSVSFSLREAEPTPVYNEQPLPTNSESPSNGNHEVQVPTKIIQIEYTISWRVSDDKDYSKNKFNYVGSVSLFINNTKVFNYPIDKVLYISPIRNTEQYKFIQEDDLESFANYRDKSLLGLYLQQFRKAMRLKYKREELRKIFSRQILEENKL